MRLIQIILFALLLSGCSESGSDKVDFTRRNAPIPEINTNHVWHLQFEYSPHHGPVGSFSIHIFSDGSVVGKFLNFECQSNVIGGRTPDWFAEHFSRWFNGSEYRNYESFRVGSPSSAPFREITLYHQGRVDTVQLCGRKLGDYLTKEDDLLKTLMILDDQQLITLDYTREDQFDELMKTESIEIEALFRKLNEM